MKELVLRIFIVFSGIFCTVIGTRLLLPWYESSVTYSHPEKAFGACLVMICSGAGLVCMGTLGWNGIGLSLRKKFWGNS